MTDLIKRLGSSCYLAFEDGTNDYSAAQEAIDHIEELVMERDMLRDLDDHFRSMCGFKRDGRSSIECFDDFLAGINKQDIPLPFDHFLQVQKERDEALAKLTKAIEALRLVSQMHGYTSRQLSDIARAALVELEKS